MFTEGFARLSHHVYWHRKTQFALDRDSSALWTLFAVVEGRFAYGIDRFEGDAGFGDLVLCPPGTWFYRKVLEPLTFHFFQFRWDSNSPALEGEAPLWIGKRQLADTKRLSSDFAYLQRLPASGRNEESIRAYKQHLLNDLWRMAGIEKEEIRPEIAVHHSTDPRIQQAREFLLVNAYTRVNMSGLAATIGLSPVQLTRGFRSAYSMTPSEFLTARRLERAERLLVETSFSIDRIAQLCGYENGFYLSRLFSRIRGVSPSAYRRFHRI
ncbi:helix-turn-helix domain-containing protein [Paenibacillus mendelii]|uniref:Helix-turn-helix domain-containing protein n=1 Tax=Paenibacillus mendelii TaxID=206163 RepID=A0ABV6J6I9_9BACL|nr:AraC family transcriptional regulator [Paenibacillus mendelii]MCQ6561130.1 AraC family transcriptional regulator [Paenibacillus mendelii]